MENVTKVKEEELELLPISVEHCKYIFSSLNDEKLVETYPISIPYTLQEAQLYIIQEIKGLKDKTSYSFAITIKKEFVGICALYDIDQIKNTAKIYYWVAVVFWNRGIATKAIKRLLKFAKEELKITELKTGVLQKNIGSKKVLEKNGFKVENRLVNTEKYHLKFIGEEFLEMKTYL